MKGRQYILKTFQNIDIKLKNLGYRMTLPRKVVYEVLCENSDYHMNATDILKRAQEIKPDIGASTIYRALLLFESLNLIYKSEFDDGFARYEIKKSYDAHGHHHLICEQCGRVTELREDLLEKLEHEIERTKDFIVKDHKVKIYGICKECRQNK